MQEDPPPLEEVYEPDVLARIDAVLAEDAGAPADAAVDQDGEMDIPSADHGPVSSNGKVAEWARTSTMGALMLGYTRAVEQLFTADPEVVQYAEDPGDAHIDDRPVRVVLVPDAPKLSKAFVRPWLFGRGPADGGDSDLG